MNDADGFLADTNVISEGAKLRPNAKVVAWAESVFERTHISAVVIGEIHRGIANLPEDSPKRAQLSEWLAAEVEAPFAGRILPMDSDVARIWLALTDEREMERADSVIAATALSRNLVLATRNVRDFRGIRGLKIFNPWDAP